MMTMMMMVMMMVRMMVIMVTGDASVDFQLFAPTVFQLIGQNTAKHNVRVCARA